MANKKLAKQISRESKRARADMKKPKDKYKRWTDYER